MPSKLSQITISEQKPPAIPVAAEVAAAVSPAAAEETKNPASTLVEFQSKSTALPEWRLKMANAVRQRAGGQPAEKVEAAAPVLRRTQTATYGANALKIEVMDETAAAPVGVHQNDTVAKALKRIEESRQKFFVEEHVEAVEEDSQAQQNKNFPFYIAARTNEPPAKPLEAKASVNVLPKPKLVSPFKTAAGDFDTNKLPLLSKIMPPAATAAEELSVQIADERAETAENVVEQNLPINEIAAENAVEVAEEIEDIPPFAMRFNAGIFDLIIGSFAGLILLAPFMISGGDWFSFSGFLAFLAVTSIVMFIYMTTAIGMFGKTLGMRMFSLELIDAEENAYPSFHQAAVSSSVYLLSLFLGGIGFLTIPFTEEKRAVHDIVSNTVMIKE